MHAHHYKTWGEAAGLPETAARLDRLPQGLDLPDRFPEPIHFDPERKRLIYRGFMCSVSYAFLRDLSPDSAYRNALDAIFQASAYALPGRQAATRRRAWPWLVSAGSLGAAALAVAWALVR